MYSSLPGGAYQKGKEFNITEKQVEQAMQFVPKFYEANVTMSKEDIQVLNKGPEAVFKLIDSRMTNAYMTLGGHVAISLYIDAQDAGLAALVNGLAEALNDGSVASWNGNTYATYGGITRAGSVSPALNSNVTVVAGPILYNTLEETYASATYGPEEPNLGLTTNKGYSFIKEKFQTQQRFNDTQDPKIGFNGMKFNGATIIRSRYAPGTQVATAGTAENVLAVDFLKESSNGAVLAYPTLGTASSETLFWLNAKKPYIRFYITDDPEYSFGFTGFKPAQGNTKVAGQVLGAIALTVPGPRYHAQVSGITG